MSADENSLSTRAARWAFADRETGKIVIVQAPNWSLWTFLIASVVSVVARPEGFFGTGVRIVATASLVIWALDELVRGANPWRRALGAGVLLFQMVRWLRS